MQFDCDTVGTDNVAADAEICMMAADALEALGLKGNYVIKINNRKVLDGIMAVIGLSGADNFVRRLTVLRAIDKFDRLGSDGVRALLGKGREDESGDFTKGADLTEAQINPLVHLLEGTTFGVIMGSNFDAVNAWKNYPQFNVNEIYNSGIDELRRMAELTNAAGYQNDRIKMDSSVVRGLEYYTGPVFEAELTFDTVGDDGKPVRFGSVGGGGRYDGLVGRFRSEAVPATGFSIGVSRLYAALKQLGKLGADKALGPVLVLVMDKDRLGDYQKMASTLRQAGIAAEMYVGTSGMKPQMKYADKRGSPCVIIQGGDEKAKGEVTIKDLIAGAKAAAAITDRAAWTEGRPAQVQVPEGKLVEAVREILARHT